MKEFTEVSSESLRHIRTSKGVTQGTVAELLGLPKNAVSKIETGVRDLADSEKKLLDLYFFGIFPKGFVRSPEDIASILDFTENEWRIIDILAKRAGQTPAAWIRSQILAYLSFNTGHETLPLVAENTPLSGDQKHQGAGGSLIADITSPRRPPKLEQAG